MEGWDTVYSACGPLYSQSLKTSDTPFKPFWKRMIYQQVTVALFSYSLASRLRSKLASNVRSFYDKWSKLSRTAQLCSSVWVSFNVHRTKLSNAIPRSFSCLAVTNTYSVPNNENVDRVFLVFIVRIQAVWNLLDSPSLPFRNKSAFYRDFRSLWLPR